MPIQPRSIRGKIPYDVEKLIEDLISTVNQQEAALTALRNTPPQLISNRPAIVLGGSGNGATLDVDPNGALDNPPLAVRVDGVSVIINGSNQLEAPGAAGGITELTGDVTAGPGSGSEAATLSNTGVSAGTYGNATNVAQVTVDGKGRVTAAANVAISGSGGITELTGAVLAGPGSGSQVATLTRNACLARKSVDQTGADYTSGANVTWDTEEYDDDNWHDNSTDPDLMVVPAGVSNVRAYAELRLAAVTVDVHVLIEFRVNGSATPAYGAQRSEVGSANPTLSIASPPIPVSPGDTIAVFLLVETDTSITVTADRSYLAVEKVN